MHTETMGGTTISPLSNALQKQQPTKVQDKIKATVFEQGPYLMSVST